MKFISERNIELVSTIKNVITVENYCKWYRLYFINENGEVKILDDVFPEAEQIPFCDNAWEPASVVEFANKRNLSLGLYSYIALIARYCEATNSAILSDEYLPSKELFDSVIVNDSGDIYNCCFDTSELSFCDEDGNVVAKIPDGGIEALMAFQLFKDGDLYTICSHTYRDDIKNIEKEIFDE